MMNCRSLVGSPSMSMQLVERQLVEVLGEAQAVAADLQERMAFWKASL